MAFPDVFTSAFSAETLRLNYLLPARVPFLAECVRAQSFFESDSFTSRVFLQTNNCIGYKFVPGSRWQVGASPHRSTESDYYAAYADIQHCAGELANWLFRRGNLFKNLTDIKDYVHKLKLCGYFGSPELQYLKGLTGYFIK